MKPVTVIHFAGNSIDEGGVFTYIRNFAPYNGCHNVMVVADDFVQEREPMLPLLRVPPFNSESLYDPVTIVRCHGLALGFHRLLNKHPHMIFHGHSRSGMLIALLLNFWGHRRVVATVHANAKQRWFYRWAKHLLSDRLFFLCPSMKKHYGLKGQGWRDCIPGGAPQVTLTEEPDKQRDKTILALGGLGAVTEWKRWHLVLEALKELPAELRVKIRFIHHGKAFVDDASKAYKEKLEQLTREHGLTECVEWRGFTAKPAFFFQEIDVLVSPSSNEPFGLSMLEALFAGVPVIAANSGGATDIIRDDENGILFCDNDSRGLATVLKQIILGKLKLPSVNHESLKAFESETLGRRWKQVYLTIIDKQA